MKNRMQKRFRKTVSTVRKSHSRMLAACRRRNSAQLASVVADAGSIPSRLRISQTVLAASETPNPTSSPWMRRYPSLHSRAPAAPRAHAPPPASRDGRGDDPYTSSGAPPAPDANAAASPASPRTTPNLAAATPDSTPRGAHDQPVEAEHERPG